MKLEQGDAFEATYKQWIRANFPFYEQIWAAFIGHDGHGRSLPIHGLSAEQERNRKKFSQAHYTFAVEAHQLDNLASSVDAAYGLVTDLKNFLHEQQRLTQLVTSIGRIRDMFKIIDEALRMGGVLYAPLQDFYAARSHILHGPRMPARVIDGLLMIPKVAKQNAAFDEWDDKSVWDEADSKSFVFFADFCGSLRDDFFALIRSLHPKIFPAAAVYFGGCRIVDVPSIESSPVPLSSGTCVVPAISAFTHAVSGIQESRCLLNSGY